MAISRKSKISSTTKMASKIQDGCQYLKFFRCVISLTPTRLKFKIWQQPDPNWLKYGNFNCFWRTNQPTDQPTNQPTKWLIEAPCRSLKIDSHVSTKQLYFVYYIFLHCFANLDRYLVQQKIQLESFRLASLKLFLNSFLWSIK